MSLGSSTRRFCQSLANSELFQSAILSLIVLNALCMGAEAIPPLADSSAELLDAILLLSQAVFVFEMAVRLGAHGARWGDFFKDFWNRFDFIVVVLSLVPAIGPLALIARLFRVFRILRILSVSDTLRAFVDGLRSGLSALFFMSLIFLIVSYLWMLVGYHLFGAADTVHWGDLGSSALTVFSLLLLQDVMTIVAAARELSEAAVLFFVLFYISFFYLAAQALRAFHAPQEQRPRGPNP